MQDSMQGERTEHVQAVLDAHLHLRCLRVQGECRAGAVSCMPAAVLVATKLIVSKQGGRTELHAGSSGGNHAVQAGPHVWAPRHLPLLHCKVLLPRHNTAHPNPP